MTETKWKKKDGYSDREIFDLARKVSNELCIDTTPNRWLQKENWWKAVDGTNHSFIDDYLPFVDSVTLTGISNSNS